MSEEFITIKSREVEQYINSVVSRLRYPGSIMKDVGNELFSITDTAFTEQRSPDGTAWKKLSIATRIARGRAADGGKKYVKSGRHTSAKFTRAFFASADSILNDSGSLLRTVRHESTDNEARLMVGPHISQVAIHQFGGMAGRGRKVHIPARPFMPIEGSGSNMDLMPKAGKRILQMMRDYVEKGTA